MTARYRPDKTLIGWVRWLLANGLPRPAVLFALDLADPLPLHIAAVLDGPRRGARPRRPKPDRRRAQAPTLRNLTARKCRRLTELGYPPAAISHMLGVDLADVRRYQRVGSHRLGTRARNPIESPWYFPGDARHTGDRYDAGAELATGQAAVELIDPGPAPEPPAPPPLPEPTQWHGDANPGASGERHGGAKLNWAAVDQIRGEHARGVSCRALARRYGVVGGTITAIVQHRTWLEGDRSPTSPPAIPVPPPAAPPAAPKPQKRRRWRPGIGLPKFGARGSGAIHDDEPSSVRDGETNIKTPSPCPAPMLGAVKTSNDP